MANNWQQIGPNILTVDFSVENAPKQYNYSSPSSKVDECDVTPTSSGYDGEPGCTDSNERSGKSSPKRSRRRVMIQQAGQRAAFLAFS